MDWTLRSWPGAGVSFSRTETKTKPSSALMDTLSSRTTGLSLCVGVGFAVMVGEYVGSGVIGFEVGLGVGI